MLLYVVLFCIVLQPYHLDSFVVFHVQLSNRKAPGQRSLNFHQKRQGNGIFSGVRLAGHPRLSDSPGLIMEKIQRNMVDLHVLHV